MISKLIRLGEIIKNPSTVPALFSWRPFSIASFIMLSTLRRKGCSFRTIIDGGANIGQFARASTQFYPEAMICSFEPNPRIARIFRANLVDRPTVHLFETALGNYNGTITFYPSSYSQESSVFPVDHGQLAPINVPVARLDSLMDNMILEPPILFKLDLQGYELEALKGADNFISKCNYILTETNFKATNQDGPIFADLQEHLRGHGFKFLQPIAFLKNEFGEINQMDAFFVREDE